MSKPSTKPPSGMRDFLADDIAKRRYVVGIIQQVYESFGFAPLETPTMENLTTLLGKYGEEGDQLLFRVLRRRDSLRRALEKDKVQESDLAEEGLRYDLTVPLARAVAEYSGVLPKFYRRYQIQPVWRADRPGKGRFREFYQCDVDITGSTEILADAEVCAAVATALHRLGFRDFKILLNHRALLRSLIAAAHIDAAQEETALVAVDKLDKIGPDGVTKELVERGISAESAARLLLLMQRSGESSNADVLQNLLQMMPDDERAQKAVQDLQNLLAASAKTAAGAHLFVEPTLARGLGYYTGPIFEISVEGLSGSMGGGGRYDNLVGMFSKQQVPAVGFSLGLERILLVMEERKMYPELVTGAEVLLCNIDVDAASLLGIATQLREQGLRVEVYPQKARLGNQLQYADKRIPFAVIAASKELSVGQVAIKHLSRGTQETVPVEQAAQWIAQAKAAPLPTTETATEKTK